MIKTLIAVTLAIFATVSSAEGFGGIEYNYVSGLKTQKGTNSNGATVTLGTTVLPATAVDLNAQFERTNNNAATANRFEIGVTQTYAIANFTPYVRAAIGEQYFTGSQHGYWAVEPGVRVAVNKDWNVGIGYRYRDAFRDNVAFKSNTARLSAEYALNKSSALTVGYDRSYGDATNYGINAGYTFKF